MRQPSSRKPDRPAVTLWVRGAWFVILTSAVLGVACGTLSEKASAVSITASASEVSQCERVGQVLLGTVDSEFDQRQRDLKLATARAGANTLLVDSFASASEGTAYNCASINPDRVAS